MKPRSRIKAIRGALAPRTPKPLRGAICRCERCSRSNPNQVVWGAGYKFLRSKAPATGQLGFRFLEGGT